MKDQEVIKKWSINNQRRISKNKQKLKKKTLYRTSTLISRFYLQKNIYKQDFHSDTYNLLKLS